MVFSAVAAQVSGLGLTFPIRFIYTFPLFRYFLFLFIIFIRFHSTNFYNCGSPLLSLPTLTLFIVDSTRNGKVNDDNIVAKISYCKRRVQAPETKTNA